MKKVLLFVVCFCLIAVGAFAGISGTKHDLHSGTNTGTAESEICVFCHTPHNADPTHLDVPLWSHLQTSTQFTLYNAKTSYSNKNGVDYSGPGGISLACLSCHDGSTAVGAIAYGRYKGTHSVLIGSLRNGASPITGNANLGADLRDDHPIGVTFPSGGHIAAGQYNDISADTTVPLYKDSNGTMRVECASCHNVHDNTYFPFLRKVNTLSALCLTCHNK